MGRHRSTTYFNRDNWNKIAHFSEDGRTQEDYRLYLVTHELMHAVGLRHHINEDAYTANDRDRPLTF